MKPRLHAYAVRVSSLFGRKGNVEWRNACLSGDELEFVSLLLLVQKGMNQ